MSGFVSLVGAGPGDPELLTLKAVNRLQAADLVLYDALVDAGLRQFASKAHWFYVGKRAHDSSSTAQETIEKLMIRYAREGQRVVRLKCGDPFVFGRGGEEGLALAQAGVPFEVIPGVSSAIAAPAVAGIPVTHRGLSTAFTVVSGHIEAAYAPVLSSLAPLSSTLVVLMGLRQRGPISALLVERGWAPSTPAAIVLNGSHHDGTRWIGTLATLASAPLPEAAHPERSRGTDAAGILVIGQVVSLAETLGDIAALQSPARASGMNHV